MTFTDDDVPAAVFSFNSNVSPPLAATGNTSLNVITFSLLICLTLPGTNQFAWIRQLDLTLLRMQISFIWAWLAMSDVVY